MESSTENFPFVFNAGPAALLRTTAVGEALAPWTVVAIWLLRWCVVLRPALLAPPRGCVDHTLYRYRVGFFTPGNSKHVFLLATLNTNSRITNLKLLDAIGRWYFYLWYMSLLIGHVNSLGGSNEHVFRCLMTFFQWGPTVQHEWSAQQGWLLGGCSNNAENPTFTLE